VKLDIIIASIIGESERSAFMRSGPKYLALALDVRKLTDSLIRLVEEGTESDDLYESIREVIASIEGAGQKTSVKALRARGMFGHYPSVLAISEVITAENREQVVRHLLGVLNTANLEERKENALEAIAFFDSLERRALYRSAHTQRKRSPALAR
jgi:hypothetical protein